MCFTLFIIVAIFALILVFNYFINLKKDFKLSPTTIMDNIKDREFFKENPVIITWKKPVFMTEDNKTVKFYTDKTIDISKPIMFLFGNKIYTGVIDSIKPQDKFVLVTFKNLDNFDLPITWFFNWCKDRCYSDILVLNK